MQESVHGRLQVLDGGHGSVRGDGCAGGRAPRVVRRLAEVARVAYLAKHAGGYLAIRAEGIEALTTEVHVRYHRAARFDDRLRIWTRCVDLRGARFRYEYAIERDGELVAEGFTTHATVDRVSHRPTRIPAWFVEAVARAEA